MGKDRESQLIEEQKKLEPRSASLLKFNGVPAGGVAAVLRDAADGRSHLAALMDPCSFGYRLSTPTTTSHHHDSYLTFIPSSSTASPPSSLQPTESNPCLIAPNPSPPSCLLRPIRQLQGSASAGNEQPRSDGGSTQWSSDRRRNFAVPASDPPRQWAILRLGPVHETS